MLRYNSIIKVVYLIIIIYFLNVLVTFKKLKSLKPLTNAEIQNLGKRIIIVGNSPNILKSKKGYLIDMFDEVIRFNNYEYLKDYTGLKTTIWVIQKTCIPINVKKKNYKYILQIASDNTLKDFEKAKNNIKINFGTLNLFLSNLNPFYNIIVTNNIRLLETAQINNKVIYATSGLTAILYFLKYYRVIYIYGFSFNTTHYYNDITQYLPTKDITTHNYDGEKVIIESLIKSGRLVKL